jgi:putative NADPH-quinone reductase
MENKLKILAINGSHRGRLGYTQFLIDKLFEGAINAGAECDTIALAEKKINECKGCRACHTEKYYLKCVFEEKDDVNEIFNRMRNADILIYATPVYIFHMSGRMKVFLDRITSTGDSAIPFLSDSGLFFHDFESKLVSKPSVLLTCQDNMEDETSINIELYFKTFCKFLNIPLAGILRRKSGALAGQGKDKEKEKKYPVIKDVYRAYIKAGEELAKYGKISKSTQKAANKNIIKMPAIVEFLLKFKFIRKNKKFMNNIFNQVKLHMTDR